MDGRSNGGNDEERKVGRMMWKEMGGKRGKEKWEERIEGKCMMGGCGDEELRRKGRWREMVKNEGRRKQVRFKEEGKIVREN